MGQSVELDLGAVIPSDRELPQRLGRYVIREIVGRGATSLVFVARDEESQEDVALKVLVPTFERSGVRRERFLREAQALRRLIHPNIVPVYDVGEEQGYCYLAMARMERSLATAGARGAALSRHLAWVHDAALGLLHAHRHGVIHRDVKPQNLLLGEDGHVRVGDFGLALLQGGNTLTLSGAALGTPYYASPEQMRGEVATVESDIFGLGATLYELVVGAPPSRPAADLPVQIPPGLPSGVRDILQRSLAQSPAERYHDMAKLIAAIEWARRQIEGVSWRALAALRAHARRGLRGLTRARRPLAFFGLLLLGVYALGARDPLLEVKGTQGFLERYRRPAARAVVPFSASRSEDRRLAAPPRDIAAYTLYLEGRAHLETHSKRGITAATEAFAAALRRDPGRVDALAGLAECYEAFWDYASHEDRDGPLLAAAEAYARRAVLQDPESDVAYTALGNILQSRGDWAGAEVAFEKALHLNPESAAAHAQYASLLAATRRNSAARQRILKALELDPLSPYIIRQAGRFHFYDGEYNSAVEFLLAALELNPDDPNTERLLADTYRGLGNPEMDLAARLRGFPWLVRPPVRVGAWMFGPEAMLKLLSRATTWRGHQDSALRAHTLAREYAWRAETDEMFAALSVAARRQLWYAAVEPVFAPYRTDPRFTEILARVGLR